MCLCFWFFVTDIKKARGVLYIAHVARLSHAQSTHISRTMPRTSELSFSSAPVENAGKEENAERFVQLLAPPRLQEWYRVELGSIPRALYAVKLRLLNELADVLDAHTLKFLCTFLSAYKKNQMLKVSSPSWTKRRAFLALLVVPDTAGPVVRHLRQKVGI